MRFCNEHGIPHSVFLDWEEADKTKAIAFMIHEAEHCQMCGTARWEWDEKQGGSRYAYQPEIEICPGCERKDWKHDEMEKRIPGAHVKLVKST